MEFDLTEDIQKVPTNHPNKVIGSHVLKLSRLSVMRMFYCNRPYDSVVECESHRIVEKRRENAESINKYLTGCYTYRQGVMPTLTRRRVGDVYCTVSYRSSSTSPEPLAYKPHRKQTSSKDKQTSQEHVSDPCQQD